MGSRLLPRPCLEWQRSDDGNYYSLSVWISQKTAADFLLLVSLLQAATKTYLYDHIVPSQHIHPSCITSSAFATNPASLCVSIFSFISSLSPSQASSDPEASSLAFLPSSRFRKVQLSSSFQLLYLSRSCVEIPESKGGGTHDLWCTTWVPEGEQFDAKDWVWDGGEGLEKLSVKDLGW